MESYKHRAIDLKGHTVIVTGSSSGIGAGIARGLAAAGTNVLVNYAGNRQGADETVQEITDCGGDALAYRADISEEHEVQALFKAAIDKWETVDILVSNAGIQKDARLLDMSLEQWNRVIQINLTGAFLCAREAAREFVRRGPTDRSRDIGKIIFISSVHEVIPWAKHVNYAAAKGGNHASHEEHRPRAWTPQNSGQQRFPGSYQDTHQPHSLGDSRSRSQAAIHDPL